MRLTRDRIKFGDTQYLGLKRIHPDSFGLLIDLNLIQNVFKPNHESPQPRVGDHILSVDHEAILCWTVGQTVSSFVDDTSLEGMPQIRWPGLTTTPSRNWVGIEFGPLRVIYDGGSIKIICITSLVHLIINSLIHSQRLFFIGRIHLGSLEKEGKHLGFSFFFL